MHLPDRWLDTVDDPTPPVGGDLLVLGADERARTRAAATDSPDEPGRVWRWPGPRGFVGTHLVPRLVAEGYEVHALLRDPAGFHPRDHVTSTSPTWRTPTP